MPVAGRKPKPDGQKRNRVKPTYDWANVPDVPYDGKVPPLPKRPGKFEGRTAPSPGRPLGTAGLALWERAWRTSGPAEVDVDALLLLCEQMDERVALRIRVLRDNDRWDRIALRALDGQVTSGLATFRLDDERSAPQEWPAETKRWWRTVSHMPHCILWTEGDWQFALDTALIAAGFHAGDMRLAAELRAREKVLGTTADARRDLRIRYIDEAADEESAEDQGSVTAMADYKQMVSGQ